MTWAGVAPVPSLAKAGRAMRRAAQAPGGQNPWHVSKFIPAGWLGQDTDGVASPRVWVPGSVASTILQAP